MKTYFGLLVLKIHVLLNPILKWITALESDKETIGMIAEAFFKINKIFPSLLPRALLSENEGWIGFNVGLELRSGLLPMVWDSSLRMVR